MKVDLLVCDFCGCEHRGTHPGWVKVTHGRQAFDACPECSKTTWQALCTMRDRRFVRAGGDS